VDQRRQDGHARIAGGLGGVLARPGGPGVQEPDRESDGIGGSGDVGPVVLGVPDAVRHGVSFARHGVSFAVVGDGPAPRSA
jgi:hypothetical protein